MIADRYVTFNTYIGGIILVDSHTHEMIIFLALAEGYIRGAC